MADNKEHRNEEALFVALEQLGKALDMMQGLFTRIEQHMADTRSDAAVASDEEPALSPDVPDSYTLH
jgi:hypothetical protein